MKGELCDTQSDTIDDGAVVHPKDLTRNLTRIIRFSADPEQSCTRSPGAFIMFLQVA